jgi:hypothetical protein
VCLSAVVWRVCGVWQDGGVGARTCSLVLGWLGACCAYLGILLVLVGALARRCEHGWSTSSGTIPSTQ